MFSQTIKYERTYVNEWKHQKLQVIAFLSFLRNDELEKALIFPDFCW